MQKKTRLHKYARKNMKHSGEINISRIVRARFFQIVQKTFKQFSNNTLIT